MGTVIRQVSIVLALERRLSRGAARSGAAR